MNKAEERAKETYPLWDAEHVYDEERVIEARKYFIEGYHQAEKDLELTWEDVRDILNIYEEVIDMDSCEDIYGEVLKRFRDYKEKRK